MDVSIVIPVKNGGDLFGKILKVINEQKTKYEYEVIVVDSGSKDSSVQIADEAGCKVFQIAPEEFGHGKTRNYGAAKGSGRYIVFITQDAMPASEDWLDELVNAMDEDMNIAGGFGKHLPYQDCNLPDQQMLENHFKRYEGENSIQFISNINMDKYRQDEEYKQFLVFFSDNCSIIRRSVWEKIPYDDVDFAEDQRWAKEIIEAGYKKIYISKAAVYHSHNYKLSTYKKRYFDEFKALYSIQDLNLVPNLMSFFKKVLGDTKYQCKYILRRSDIKCVNKLYWCIYSFRRNIMRYQAAHDAVHYFTLSAEGKEKMDHKYSLHNELIQK